MRKPLVLTVILAATVAATPLAWRPAVGDQIAHLQGEMVGEVSATSAILQSRLTGPKVDDAGDVPGARGVGRFEVAHSPSFETSNCTPWIAAEAEHDYIVKSKVTGLQPSTRYYYRLQFGSDSEQPRLGPARTFRTHPKRDQAARISFVVVTGMNYAFFHHGRRQNQPETAYQGPDKHLGYPGLAAMAKLQPDFFVGTGDNVYYDHYAKNRATTAAEMRKKWHEQFVQPRFVELFGRVPTYWEKDDHDHRYNDNDNTGDKPPSSELGIRIFREQVPVVDPTDPGAVTYRTFRIGKLLAIWLVEGRDYRSPNASPDGPEKTIWGETQRAWLKQTLVESDAAVKLIISPTPMVGPDDAYKKDNHTNPDGFRHEGTVFFNWAKENGFLEKGLYFICGDRHWQYHSIHPLGFEEFSCGALVDANSRMGVAPGAKKGTDPEAKIKQPYSSREPSGGFLNVVVGPGADANTATATFNFHDENGLLLHAVTKSARVGR
ncbi:MAG: alkaline phosphatase D family protein [Planctomycetota bacterium]|jgi:alkaline phosphatase/alkaline phosphatase D